jgi:hypothetical protein
VKAWVAWTEEYGLVVYGKTRGQARAAFGDEVGMTFDECFDVKIIRAPAADEYHGKRIPDAVMRALHFHGDSEDYCATCGFADPSDGKQPDWVVCHECNHCGECEHDSDCAEGTP